MLDFKCVSLKIFFRKSGGKTKNCCAVVLYFSLMSGSEVMMLGTIILQTSVSLCLLIKHENQVLSWGNAHSNIGFRNQKSLLFR